MYLEKLVWTNHNSRTILLVTQVFAYVSNNYDLYVKTPCRLTCRERSIFHSDTMWNSYTITKYYCESLLHFHIYFFFCFSFHQSVNSRTYEQESYSKSPFCVCKCLKEYRIFINLQEKRELVQYLSSKIPTVQVVMS